MNHERLKYLFERYTSKTCTQEEKQELAILGLVSDNQSVIEDLLEEFWQRTPLRETMPGDKGALILEKIINPSVVLLEQPKGKTIRMYWKRIAVAISAILIVGVGYHSFFAKRKADNKNPNMEIAGHDVKAPGANKAMITLANGQKIYLDSSGNGTLAVQRNVKLMKLANGEIAYQAGNEGDDREMQYNTLVNPQGSQVINMVLTDGSKVWLNAGSSLTYPVMFMGNERKVSITGEAYFEVAHDAGKSFRVNKEGMQVEVLGTHFNVNAYDDEADIKVTLLEGVVKINKANRSEILKPGQQARVNDGIIVSNDVDLDEVMAWKNGLFEFSRADLHDVLKQLSRWYDVEVVYQEKVQPKEFVGEMERGLTLSQVLRILEKNDVHFKIEGKRIIVLR